MRLQLFASVQQRRGLVVQGAVVLRTHDSTTLVNHGLRRASQRHWLSRVGAAIVQEYP